VEAMLIVLISIVSLVVGTYLGTGIWSNLLLIKTIREADRIAKAMKSERDELQRLGAYIVSKGGKA